MIVPELLGAGVLAITDMHNVEAFCVAYDKWRMAEEEVQSSGITVTSAQGSPMKNPALTAANEAMRQDGYVWLAARPGSLQPDPAHRRQQEAGGESLR